MPGILVDPENSTAVIYDPQALLWERCTLSRIVQGTPVADGMYSSLLQR